MKSRLTTAHPEKSKLDAENGIMRLSDFELYQGKEKHREFLKQNLPHVDLELDSPDETWLQLDGNNIVGHFSLWYCDAPVVCDEKAGYIGHYYARNVSVGKNVLLAAASLLKKYGCQMAVGPVDGNTWRRYRLVCGTSDVRRFLMEPENPMEYPGHFIASGFEVLATYSSSILDVKPQFATSSLSADGKSDLLSDVTIRTINLDNFERELHGIYGIACDAFEDSFLYTEISEIEFIARYQKLKQIVNPELVLIAEYNNHPVGFVLAVPDPANSNSVMKTVILKTIGRIKDDRFRGLGVRLMAECHARADKLGFTNFIHALYKDDNTSSLYSTMHDAHVFRKYAVYGKMLRLETIDRESV